MEQWIQEPDTETLTFLADRIARDGTEGSVLVMQCGMGTLGKMLIRRGFLPGQLGLCDKDSANVALARERNRGSTVYERDIYTERFHSSMKWNWITTIGIGPDDRHKRMIELLKDQLRPNGRYAWSWDGNEPHIPLIEALVFHGFRFLQTIHTEKPVHIYEIA